MKKIKGPGIFLAQFLRDEKPYNNLMDISKWVASLGYKGVQIPTWDPRAIDLKTAAESSDYCDEMAGRLQEIGIGITELASHLQGQVLAMNNAYRKAFAAFYPEGMSKTEVVEWSTDQLKKTVSASVNLGLNAIPALSGGFGWHMVYPWPQRPAGLIEEAFSELFKRWKPVLDFADEKGPRLLELIVVVGHVSEHLVHASP